MKALQLRGIRIPHDVAVVGFNDSLEGQLTTPPLTSVALPFYEQGTRAVEAIADLLAGRPVPDQVVLQSRLMVRQSCGCPAGAVVQAAADVPPPHLHIWVADTGPGIAPDQQDNIFEPFVSAGPDRAGSGIGLGLSITRHLIALPGGSITLYSEPGRGSTFHIYLPLPRLGDQPPTRRM